MSLPAVLGGPGGGPGGGPSGKGCPVLVVSGSEKGIHAGERSSLHMYTSL